jgi:hypothetical protein
MEDLNVNVVKSISILISQLIHLIESPTPIELNSHIVSSLVKRNNYNMNIVKDKLSELLNELIDSQHKTFMECRGRINELVCITSSHPYLTHANTFIVIVFRIIMYNCNRQGHLERESSR